MIQLNEFLPYFIIGGIATMIDWSLFWSATHLWNLHYESALIIGYLCAGIFHYAANKWITFQCHSKQIGTQYSVYVTVTLVALLISMLIIALCVNLLLLTPIHARIITTLWMLIPNYLLHKHITFNKKYFNH